MPGIFSARERGENRRQKAAGSDRGRVPAKRVAEEIPEGGSRRVEPCWARNKDAGHEIFMPGIFIARDQDEEPP